MYINPFWAGVAATVIAEIALVIVAVIIETVKSANATDKSEKRRNDND